MDARGKPAPDGLAGGVSTFRLNSHRLSPEGGALRAMVQRSYVSVLISDGLGMTKQVMEVLILTSCFFEFDRVI